MFAGRTILFETRSHKVPGPPVEFSKDKYSFDIIRINEGTAELYDKNDQRKVIADIRRSLLLKVPSMAIQTVAFEENSTGDEDAVIRHCLEMIPIKANVHMFEYLQNDNDKLTEQNSIAFTLDVTNDDPQKKTKIVYSSDLKLKLLGNRKFSDSDMPRVVSPDIMLFTLDYGERIALTAYCIKGTGEKHDKFSPGAPVFMTFDFEVKESRKVTGEEAHKLKSLFDEGVIKVRKVDGVATAQVKDALTFYKNRFRLKDTGIEDAFQVMLGRPKCVIESSGSRDVEEIIREGIEITLPSLEVTIRTSNKS